MFKGAFFPTPRKSVCISPLFTDQSVLFQHMHAVRRESLSADARLHFKLVNDSSSLSSCGLCGPVCNRVDRGQQTGYYLAAKLQLPLGIPSNGFQTMKKPQGVSIEMDVNRGGVPTTADLSVCKNVCVIWSNLMIKQITATLFIVYVSIILEPSTAQGCCSFSLDVLSIKARHNAITFGPPHVIVHHQVLHAAVYNNMSNFTTLGMWL